MRKRKITYMPNTRTVGLLVTTKVITDKCMGMELTSRVQVYPSMCVCDLKGMNQYFGF